MCGRHGGASGADPWSLVGCVSPDGTAGAPPPVSGDPLDAANPLGHCARKVFVEDPEGCVGALRTQLFFLTVVKPVYEVLLQLIVPWVVRRYNLYRLARRVRKQEEAAPAPRPPVARRLATAAASATRGMASGVAGAATGAAAGVARAASEVVGRSHHGQKLDLGAEEVRRRPTAPVPSARATGSCSSRPPLSSGPSAGGARDADRGADGHAQLCGNLRGIQHQGEPTRASLMVSG